MPYRPFVDFIANYKSLTQTKLPTPEVKALPPSWDKIPERTTKPLALLLSPHPDDECLTGGLPLRLKRERDWQIINVAVTLGSNKERRTARLNELAKSCALLDFDILLPAPDAFRVTPEIRNQSPSVWQKTVERIAEILLHYKPEAIFLPNIRDWNRTHIGTYYLGLDALTLMPKDFSCLLVQTEYWQPNALPNLMVGLNDECTATLLTALACHEGELTRTPYHIRFPAYLSDNVRRGSERLGGQGSQAIPFDFAMLYQLDLWRGGKIHALTKSWIVDPKHPLDFFNQDSLLSWGDA